MDSRRVGKFLAVLVGVLCLALAAPAASADSKVRIVRISYVEGDVQVDHGQGQGFQKAMLNMPVTENDRLRTNGEKSLAEVQFEDGSALRLAPNSMATMHELGLRGSGQRVTALSLDKGTAYFDVRKHMGEFRVSVDGHEFMSVHPNSVFRIDESNGTVNLAVFKGDLEIPGPEKTVKVKKDETFTLLDLNDPEQYQLSKGIQSDSFDNWNHQREQYDVSTASSYSDLGYSGFSPAYSYGLADLSYYGSYNYLPGWGLFWQPFFMGTGWSPFMDGAWAMYPGMGYMWVSAYPWGWLPYHYGAWNFIPGFGWGWMPCQTWNAWLPFAPVVSMPAGYVAPRPPVVTPIHGTAPALVAVGRANTVVFPANMVHTPAAGSSIPTITRGSVAAIPGTTMGAAGMPGHVGAMSPRVSGGHMGGMRSGIGSMGSGIGHVGSGVGHVGGSVGHAGGGGGGHR